MKWSYKTVHFELKKEGLLGGAFLDETEIEEQLNDYGRSGWELISVIEVQDGIIAFFKQSISLGRSAYSTVQVDPEPAEEDDDREDRFEPVEPEEQVYRVMETDQGAVGGDEPLPEARTEEGDRESAVGDDRFDGDPHWEGSDDRPPDYQGMEEFEEKVEDDPAEKSIGAIRIE